MKSKKGKITIAIIAVCVVVALTSRIMLYLDCGTPISSVLYFVAMTFGSAKVCEFSELHDDWEEWEREDRNEVEE